MPQLGGTGIDYIVSVQGRYPDLLVHLLAVLGDFVVKPPSGLDWHLYGGGMLVAVGSAAVFPAAGLIVLGAWLCYLGRLYVMESNRGKE